MVVEGLDLPEEEQWNRYGSCSEGCICLIYSYEYIYIYTKEVIMYNENREVHCPSCNLMYYFDQFWQLYGYDLVTELKFVKFE